MHPREQVLCDSGKYPCWLRIPMTLVGIGILCFGFAIAAHALFGTSLGLGVDSFRDQGTQVAGFLGCMLSGTLGTGMWF